MRALIIGATGLVGGALLKEWRARPGWEVVGTWRTQRTEGLEALDVLNGGAVAEAIGRHRSQVVVMAASNPHVDFCETHPDETRGINVEAPVAVAKAADAAGVPVVFFYSDYVFDGKKNNYGEHDPTAPLNVYGRQKLEAERGIAAAASQHVVLRISGAYGWESARKNFVLQVVDRIRSGQRVRAATDVVYHPTYAPNLAPVLASILQAQGWGVYHTVGHDASSRYDFAVAAAKAFGLDPAMIDPIVLADLKAAAARPLRSCLRSDRLWAEARRDLWGIQQALTHMKASQPAAAPSAKPT
ncbi:MAG: SDR family oxidoreductase [Elusimicrobia bacterium]|nr:SDR family oxidoreductase [Elusimicrobiota bacterium]